MTIHIKKTWETEIAKVANEKGALAAEQYAEGYFDKFVKNEESGLGISSVKLWREMSGNSMVPALSKPENYHGEIGAVAGAFRNIIAASVTARMKQHYDSWYLIHQELGITEIADTNPKPRSYGALINPTSGADFPLGNNTPLPRVTANDNYVEKDQQRDGRRMGIEDEMIQNDNLGQVEWITREFMDELRDLRNKRIQDDIKDANSDMWRETGAAATTLYDATKGNVGANAAFSLANLQTAYQAYISILKPNGFPGQKRLQGIFADLDVGELDIWGVLFNDLKAGDAGLQLSPFGGRGADRARGARYAVGFDSDGVWIIGDFSRAFTLRIATPFEIQRFDGANDRELSSQDIAFELQGKQKETLVAEDWRYVYKTIEP